MNNLNNIRIKLVEVREALDMLEMALQRNKNDEELVKRINTLKSEENELVSQLTQRSDIE